MKDFATDGSGACLELLRLDWSSALFAYSLGKASSASLKAEGPGGAFAAKSAEASGLGRLELRGLEAASNYAAKLEWDGGELAASFSTLEKPPGKPLGSFAIVADPHLSLKKENRKGRIFVESPLLLEDVVWQCGKLALDAVLMPGDLTNDGTEEEFARCASILKGLKAPLLAVPGNHDFHSKEGAERWRRSFGPLETFSKIPYGSFIGLDTANGALSKSGAKLLERGMEEGGLLAIETHYQLFADPDPTRGKLLKPVSNAKEIAPLLERLTGAEAIVYAGHQNVPAIARPGANCLQANVVQPTQYPCGFLLAQVYADRVCHSFQPISSEVLRQWSRLAGDEAATFYGEAQWRQAFRRGDGAGASNFVFKRKGTAR